MSLERAVALEPQLAIDPLDRAVLAREPDAVLAPARRPREEHRHQALGVLEVQPRRVLDLVSGAPQPPGPGAHRGRRPRDVEQLVDEMGAVVEQHAASPRHAGPAPRHPGGRAPRIGRLAVHRKLGQVPPPDRPLAQPILHLDPHGVEPILVTRHHDPAVGARRGGDAVRFDPRERHRLLTHDVVAALQAPQGEVQVRGRRRTNVDEVEGTDVGELLGVREQRDALDRRHVCGAVYEGDDIDARAHAGHRPQRREMRLPRRAARPDDGTTVPLHVRRTGRRRYARARGRR